MKHILRMHEAWRKHHVKRDIRRMGRGANSAGYVLRRLRTQSTQRFLASLEIIVPPFLSILVGQGLDPAATRPSAKNLFYIERNHYHAGYHQQKDAFRPADL